MAERAPRPRVGDRWKTPMSNYLIVASNLRTGRVTFFDFGSLRRTTIKWKNFLSHYDPTFVEHLL